MTNDFVIRGNCSVSRIGVTTCDEKVKSISWSGFRADAEVSFTCRRRSIFPSEPAAAFVPAGVDTTNVALSRGSSEPMFVTSVVSVTVTAERLKGCDGVAAYVSWYTLPAAVPSVTRTNELAGSSLAVSESAARVSTQREAALPRLVIAYTPLAWLGADARFRSSRSPTRRPVRPATERLPLTDAVSELATTPGLPGR